MSRWASPVTEVLYVAKTHLDVGFTATAAGVRDRYLQEFFPTALEVAGRLRDEGGPARLRWTTGAWILTEALDAASGSQRARLERAITDGDLTWQALPFTLHTELCDRSLLRHALSLSAELDRRFERRTRAAKMTDVPGHTRSMVSVLADAGVDFLHIGVNPAASAPEVPLQFRWRDIAAGSAEAPSVSVMYQPASYGDVQVIEGTGTAVYIDLTGDNLGPADAATIRDRFEMLSTRFPGAVVRAASLDDVADAVRDGAASLSTIDEEIGDTWLHGTASDPPKLAAFRALCRVRRRWIENGLDPSDPALARASTRLLLVAEHTWGLDQKEHWPETGHWSAAELATVREDPATRAFEASWAEQREYLHEFCNELGASHPQLAAEARSEVRAALDRVAPPPVLREPAAEPVVGEPVVGEHAVGDSAVGEPVAAGERVDIGGFEVVLGEGGSVVSMLDATGREWAGSGRRLGAVGERTFDAADYERWFATYNGETRDEDEWWARWDNTKPGLENTNAVSRWWPVRMSAAALSKAPDGAVLTVRVEVEGGLDDPIALRSPVTMTVRALSPHEVEFGLHWRRDAARWPEATWWSFEPATVDPAVLDPAVVDPVAQDRSAWRMRKAGEWVDPGHVVAGGATLHAVEALCHPGGLRLDPLDAPLVSNDPDMLLRWDSLPEADDAAVRFPGWHFLLQANLWGTNFPMWTDDWCVARVVLSCRPDGSG